MRGNLSKHIVVIDPSDLLYEGLIAVLEQRGIPVIISRLPDLDALVNLSEEILPEMVIMNPVQLMNRARLCKSIRKNHPKIQWIALVYAYFDQGLLSFFDAVIEINTSSEHLAKVVMQMIALPDSTGTGAGNLSDRETEVLLLLINGLQNKEIADKLNISVHTVISHRKNISIKTGIKSQAGLAIYALSNRLISLD